MSDPYLYPDVPVLKNILNIKNEKTLELIESEQSRANMMLLYEQGFSDFSPEGFKYIHQFLFGDIYEWAGEFRIINIEKRERLLGGRSVWYSNDDCIEEELNVAFQALNNFEWKKCTKDRFVSAIAQLFPPIWRIHPFREGNTRTVVTMMAFFIESHGYSFDKELFAESAGYVRDSFVMASIGKYSEVEHLEKILNDAISNKQIDTILLTAEKKRKEKNQNYQRKPYTPSPHNIRQDD